jgi:hypothetical protein
MKVCGRSQTESFLVVQSVLNACFLRLLCFLGDKRLGFLDKAQFRLFFSGGFGLLCVAFGFGILFWDSVMGRR